MITAKMRMVTSLSFGRIEHSTRTRRPARISPSLPNAVPKE
jgi:hypothetical protein